MQRRPYLILLLPALGLAALSLALYSMLAAPWSSLVLITGCWLTLPLLTLAAASADPRRERGAGASGPGLASARLLASAALILAHALLVSGLVLPPLLWWQQQPSLAASLAIAAAATVAMLLPWRWWPALVLPVLDRGEGLDTPSQTPVRIARALRAARELTTRQEVYFSHGLPILFLHAVWLLTPAALALMVPDWRLQAPALAILLALAWLGYGWAQRRVRALLDRLQEPGQPVAAEPAAAEPIPQRPVLRAAALREALREGRVERALVLIEAGAEVTTSALPDEADQRDALTIAATLNDSRPLRAMIATGVSIEHRCQGLTPLLVACRDSYYGRAEIVLALIANGADLRARDEDDRTPLHHAALSMEPAVAAMLLDAGAAIDAVDREGFTPLARACAVGNLALVRLFLERRAATAVTDALPALCAAAAAPEEQLEIVQRLLRARADVGGRDGEGRTALHHAVLAGHEGVVQCLLDAGADVDARDQDDRTALKLLEQTEAPAALRDRLIAAGAESDTPPEVSVEDLELSIQLPIDPATVRPASLLAGGRQAALHEWLRTATPGQRADLLLEATLQGAQPVVALVLSRPLPAETRLGDGRLLIEAALDAWPLTRSLLLALPGSGVSVSGGAWLARLLATAGSRAEDRETIALAWVEAGADLFAADPNGIDPLHHAVAQGLDRLALRLLERGVNSQRRDFAGYTPLHRALDHDDERARRLIIALLRNGADPQALASSGETPLGLAMNGDRRELVEWLRWSRWPLPRRRLQAHDLAAASQAGDLPSVRRLLAMGLDCQGRDAQGCTALIHAAGGGHLDVLDELLAHGADVDACTPRGVNALVAAIISGQNTIVGHLLERGASARAGSGGVNPPLLVAAACGAEGCIEQLLRAGARPISADAAGNTPLHAAAGYAFGSDDGARVRRVLISLLSSGAEADASNGAGLTPLHLACGAAATCAAVSAGVDAALDVLLSRSRDADRPDENGCTPLHYAAANGQLGAVRRLLKRGADPDRRDQGGWRAEDYAGRYGFTDVVQELRSPRAPTPMPMRPA